MAIESPHDLGLTELQDKLDGLLERYLDLVDCYKTAQEAVQKQLAAGFFSLARANKDSPRQRYGQDFYDQRMKASRRCIIEVDQDGTIDVEVCLLSTTNKPTGQEGSSTTAADEPKQQPSPPSTPSLSNEHTHAVADENSNTNLPSDTAPSLPPAPSDPLRWFGILTPQELRKAQSAFADAIEHGVSAAATSARAMRSLEGDIARLRKTVRKVEKAQHAPL